MLYSDDDLLMLSGTQHYMFCPRQWALIELEQVWEDNWLTTEGNLLHANVDNPDYRAKNNRSIILRRVSLVSYSLGFYGFSDAVELVPCSDPRFSIECEKYNGRFALMPIEYKRGKPKQDLCDIIQLVSQTMCLEEMYGIEIAKSALFYWETRRRLEIDITLNLRQLVHEISSEMHSIVQSGIMPKPVKTTKCRSCSLFNLCIPSIGPDVDTYLNQNLYA